MTILLVLIGGAIGASLRYLTDRAVTARQNSRFPWGTFTANVAGSFILGLLVQGAALGRVTGDVSTLVGTGLCGALTTYSTFGYETVRLFQERLHTFAVLNVVGSIAAGLGAAFCGIAVADAVWS